MNAMVRLLLLISMAPALSVAAPAVAQQLEDRRLETVRELDRIRDEIKVGQERRDELAAEIEKLERDRAAINRELIDTTARQRDIEKRIDRTGDRLGELREQQAEVHRSLGGRKALLAEVLAALQRMGRQPPPAILVTPADALSAVRSAMLLSSVIPEIRAESEILVAELSELVRIDQEIESQRAELTGDLRMAAEEEERLTLLLAEKKEITNSARLELANQGARAAELAARESSLGALIDTLEQEIAAAREAAEKAEAARMAALEREKRLEEVDRPKPPEKAVEPDFSDTARIAPAIAFDKAKGRLPMPAAGVIVRDFGEETDLGDPAAGISIATRINARIVAPADGWVVYSGPFRSYGQLLILNAGSGYHIVMAGMEKANVELGQFVLAGEPVAEMGAHRIASAETVGLESSRPVLYVEFRKDGKSIDPSPWWADDSLGRPSDDT